MTFQRSARWLTPVGLYELRNHRATLRRLGVAPDRVRTSARSRILAAAHLDVLGDNALSNVRGIVDVGAHVGLWSQAILAVCTPDRLLAVEPSPQVLSELRGALAGHPCATVLPVAAGARNGTLDLHLTEAPSGTSALRPRTEEMNIVYGEGYDVTSVVPVDVRPLDVLTEDLDEITVLKIDVQGFEASVIEGARATLRRTRSLMIEVNFASHYHDDTLFPEVHRMLVAQGLRLRALSSPWLISGRAMWSDAVYERAN